MKTIKVLFLTSLIVVLLAACAAPAAPTAAPEPTKAPEATKAAEPTAAAPAASGDSIAVILTGPHEDNSWNEAAYNAIKALEKKGVKVAYSESIAEGNEGRVLREYADQGFKMIVGHSFGYQDNVFKVATEYPAVNFAWAGGINKTAKNVADYEQPFYEAAYSIGIIAGSVSKTGVLGALYGFDIPVCHSMGEALLAGAKTVNPNAKLVVTAVGDWVDVAKAKEAALAQIDAGVDYMIECGEGPALGAIAAAKEKSIFVTSYVGDMTENGPDVVLVNLVWNLEPLFAQMLKDTKEGTFNGPYYKYGVAQGAMLFTINDKLKDKIPAEALEKANKAMDDIKAGTLVVPFIPE